MLWIILQAQEVGLQKGDIITKINGVNVRTTDDILLEVQLSKGKSLDLVVNRDGKKLDLNVTPKLDEAKRIICFYGILLRKSN